LCLLLEVEQWQSRDSRADVGAGVLTRVTVAEVNDVVGQLEGDTDLLAVLLDRTLELGRAVRQQHSEVGRGGDERSGLVAEHLEVVLDGVVTGPGADRLVQLPEAQALEGIGLERRDDLAETRDEA